MPPRTQIVIVEQFVKTPPAQVYRAFTNATVLREWLCDVATVAPKPGGRMYLWWNGDYYSSGEYVALKPDKKIVFKWFGRGEAKPTPVTITLKKQNGGTHITLAHKIPTGKQWQGSADGFKNEWVVSLENLASVLETGKDLRIFNRPMLGIAIGDFTAEQAANLGVPVTVGMRLDATLENMGAYAAGLRGNDVIVNFNGHPITDFSSLVVALQGKKGGDRVEVEFYRGPEKKTVTMELSRRPTPEVIWEPKELAKRLQARYDEDQTLLEKAFEGVSEIEAGTPPAPGEWSAKEVLAHLILGYQFNPNFYAQAFTGSEPWTDDFGGNSHELTHAVVVAFPTLPELFAEMRHLARLMVAFVEAWPPEFVANKSTYFRLAWPLLEGQTHTQSHAEQIKAAIAAARKG